MKGLKDVNKIPFVLSSHSWELLNNKAGKFCKKHRLHLPYRSTPSMYIDLSLWLDYNHHKKNNPDYKRLSIVYYKWRKVVARYMHEPSISLISNFMSIVYALDIRHYKK